MLDLTREDLRYAQTLHEEVIKPNAELLMEAFYLKLFQDREAKKILEQGFSLKKLKKTQKAYLLSLGRSFDQLHYFEERLRIGHVHLRAGIRPSLYQCAYRLLQELIIDTIPPDHEHYQELISFVLKITTLDMSLAIEAYEDELAESLEYPGSFAKLKKRNIDQLAATDSLTHLLSRAGFLVILRKRLENANGEIPIAIIILDINQFQHINETHGYAVGDQVIQRAADRIRCSVRAVNAVGRFGGEEFAIVLHNMPYDEAEQVATRVKSRLENRPLKVENLVIPITVGIGIACTDGIESLESLIGRAHKALKKRKQHHNDQ